MTQGEPDKADQSAVDAVTHRSAVDAVPHQSAVDAVPHQSAVDAVTHRSAVDAVPHGSAVEAVTHRSAVEAVTHRSAVDAVPHRSAVEAVLEFLECINQHDVDKLAEHMTPDHVFIDSLGHSVSGRENMRAGWRGYFSFCPDYWVRHEEIFPSGKMVAVFGAAGGTIAANGMLLPENKWRAWAAWLAVVENGLVKQWRVYADNKPVYDILARPKTSPAQ